MSHPDDLDPLLVVCESRVDFLQAVRILHGLDGVHKLLRRACEDSQRLCPCPIRIALEASYRIPVLAASALTSRAASRRPEAFSLKQQTHGLGQREGLPCRRARRAVCRRRQAAQARPRDGQPPHRGAGGRARRQTVRSAHDRREADQRRRAVHRRGGADGERVSARAGRNLRRRSRTLAATCASARRTGSRPII